MGSNSDIMWDLGHNVVVKTHVNPVLIFGGYCMVMLTIGRGSQFTNVRHVTHAQTLVRFPNPSILH
jgi:hypothetical protein